MNEQERRKNNKRYLGLNDEQYDCFEKLMGQKMSGWPDKLKKAAVPYHCGDELACNVADWVKSQIE